MSSCIFSVIQANTYLMLHSLLAPDKPESKMYKDLVDTQPISLRAHYLRREILFPQMQSGRGRECSTACGRFEEVIRTL